MSAGDERWRAGHTLLESRVRAMPALLRRAAGRARPTAPFDPGAVRGVVVTGVGSSWAHARYLASLLATHLGLRARALPLSAFASPPGAESADEALVVISQGLSPNARVPLRHARSWKHVVVMTAAGADASPASGGHDVPRPPDAAVFGELRRAGVTFLRFAAGEQEYGTLLRVIGPMAGYVCALDFACALAGADATRAAAGVLACDLERVAQRLDDAPAAIDRVLADAAADAGHLLDGAAFVVSGGYGELVENLRAKVLEGLLVAAPPVWDVLETAHGPFQQAYERTTTFLALTRADAAGEAELLARFERMLVPGRHRLLRLAATLPGPQAVFEHEALVNELVLRAIAGRGVDQVRWPGRGHDAPLYAVAEPVRAAAAPVVLERLTWPELDDLLAAAPRTAVVPLGATEQHGPHLSFATDTRIAQALADRFCTAVEEAIRCPVVPLGCSSEHMAFPGTLDLRPQTFVALLTDVVVSLARHGFACAFVFSAHGGNEDPLRDALPALRAAAAPMQVIAFVDLPALTAAWHAASATYGVAAAASGHHAGEFETSIVSALAPADVRRARLEPGLTAVEISPAELFYPSLRRHAPSGTVGDPSRADAARAEPYLDAWVALLLETYRREKKRQ